MSRNPILSSIELAPNHTVFTKGAADRLGDLAQCAVRVELLADCAGGGEDGGVLYVVCECERMVRGGKWGR